MANPVPEIVTEEAYLKKRDQAVPLTPEMEANMKALLIVVNTLINISKLVHYGVSSGYRPAAINSATIGAATHSAHMTCEAIDLRDPGGKISTWCANNLDVLIRLGLYMESPKATPGWCHLQTRIIPSGHRIFIP